MFLNLLQSILKCIALFSKPIKRNFAIETDFSRLKDRGPGRAERHRDEADLDVADRLLQLLHLRLPAHFPQRLRPGQPHLRTEYSGFTFEVDFVWLECDSFSCLKSLNHS